MLKFQIQILLLLFLSVSIAKLEKIPSTWEDLEEEIISNPLDFILHQSCSKQYFEPINIRFKRGAVRTNSINRGTRRNPRTSSAVRPNTVSGPQKIISSAVAPNPEFRTSSNIPTRPPTLTLSSFGIQPNRGRPSLPFGTPVALATLPPRPSQLPAFSSFIKPKLPTLPTFTGNPTGSAGPLTRALSATLPSPSLRN